MADRTAYWAAYYRARKTHYAIVRRIYFLAHREKARAARRRYWSRHSDKILFARKMNLSVPTARAALDAMR